jgi:hypothetical protein
MLKRCQTCKIEKTLDSFGFLKSSKDGLRPMCKECRKIEGKNYRINNKEKTREASKRWAKQNPLKHKAIRSRYTKSAYDKNPQKYIDKVEKFKIENPEKYKEYRSRASQKYNKKKYKEDPMFRMIVNVRSAVRLKNHFSQSTLEVLGCSYEFFRSYIEEKFVDGMTWDNHGEWHFDHIKPISLAKTKEEALKLSHYTNFQPLWALDNRKKSNKYTELK